MPDKRSGRGLLCLVGPTGAGKTRIALALAERFHGAVVNLDSRQAYRDFPVITAQPTPEERAVCPHLLYGHLESGEKITAGVYVDQARSAVAELRDKGFTPILVGGTGLYLRALLHGLAPIPAVPEAVNQSVVLAATERGLAALHAELAVLDPAYAAKIHPNDRQRILRALEVHQATGRPFSWWHARPANPSAMAEPACVIGLTMPLATLEPLLAKRIEAMLAAGAVEEAREAFARCPDPEAPAWSGIGCAELLRHIQGELSLDEARALWLKNTRAYAKRQMTWFRKEADISWFSPLDPACPEAVIDHARAFFDSRP